MKKPLSLGGWRKRSAAFRTTEPHALPIADAAVQQRVLRDTRALIAPARLDPAVRAALQTLTHRLVAIEVEALGAEPGAGTLRDAIRARELAAQHAEQDPHVALTAWQRTLTAVVTRLVGASPAPTTASAMTVALVDAIPDPAPLIEHIVSHFLRLADNPQYPGAAVGRAIKNNLCDLAGLPEEAIDRNPRRITWPSASRLTGTELVRAYLKDTPFEALLCTQVPFTIPIALTSNHSFTDARSGWGKTTMLAAKLITYLAEPDPPALIVLDAAGRLIDEIKRFAVFDPNMGRLRDRFLLFDIADPVASPVLNLFDLGLDRMRHLTPREREAVTNQADEIFMFLFGLLDHEFVGQQRQAIPYLLRLLQQLPHPSLRDLLNILNELSTTIAGSAYAQHIARLDPTTQIFFERFFRLQQSKATREQIVSRLLTLMQKPTIERLFSGARSSISVFDCLRTKKILFVNLSEDVLTKAGARLVGGYFIANYLAAAFARASIPEHQLHRAILVIDEGGDYCNASSGPIFERILLGTRKFLCGLDFFFHNLKQPTEEFRRSLSNAAIKMAGRVDEGDERYMAATLQTTVETLRGVQKRDYEWTQFTVHVEGRTPHAVRVTLPYNVLHNQPKMSTSALALLLERNRARLGLTQQTQTPTPTTAPSPQPTATPLIPASNPPEARPVAAIRPAAATTAIRVGHTECVRFADFDVPLDARFEPRTDRSLLRVAEFKLVKRAREEFVEFTVSGNLGARHSYSLPALPGVDPPAITLTLQLAGHTVREDVTVRQSAERPALVLGSGFLGTRFAVDPAVSFLHSPPPRS